MRIELIRYKDSDIFILREDLHETISPNRRISTIRGLVFNEKGAFTKYVDLECVEVIEWWKSTDMNDHMGEEDNYIVLTTKFSLNSRYSNNSQ